MADVGRRGPRGSISRASPGDRATPDRRGGPRFPADSRKGSRASVSQRVKETFKKHIDILLEDVVEDIDLIQILPSAAVQVIKDVNDYLEEKKKDPLGSSMVEELTKQINSLEDPNQRIRDLLQKRIVDFCKQVISGTMKNMQVMHREEFWTR